MGGEGDSGRYKHRRPGEAYTTLCPPSLSPITLPGQPIHITTQRVCTCKYLSRRIRCSMRSLKRCRAPSRTRTPASGTRTPMQPRSVAFFCFTARCCTQHPGNDRIKKIYLTLLFIHRRAFYVHFVVMVPANIPSCATLYTYTAQ